VLEEVGKLQQGKKSAAEYFLKLEQLANIAGIDLNRYPNSTLLIEKNVQHILVDQLYQSDNLPMTYQDYKRRIVAMDEMRCRCDMHWNPHRPIAPHVRELSAMEVDQATRKETRKCFICSKEGHLARTCPDREKRQGF
jgi:hypothetical protein